jgi:hypothetical protein
LQAAENRLYARLSGDAAVAGLVGARIYASLASQGASFPLVLFNYQGGQDLHAVGSGGRIWTRSLYLVKAVCEGGSYGPAAAIAGALDAALEGYEDTVTLSGVAYHVSVAGRETPVRYTEGSEGKIYRHSGGIYRLLVWA